MIGEFLREIPGIDRNIEFGLDPRHDLLRERNDRLIELHLLNGAEVRRRAHARDRQEDEDLLFHRKIHVQVTADPVDQAVDAEELPIRGQVVIGVRQLSDKVSGQKAVHHDEQVALEHPSHLFLKRFLLYFGPDHLPDIVVQRIVTVKRLKAALQDVCADIQLLAVEDHPFARLADDAEPERLQVLPELFQVADERRPADVHLVRELVRKDGAVRPHQFSEYIVLATSRCAEDPVDAAYFVKCFPVLFGIKDPEAVASLHTLNRRAAVQVLVQLTDVIPYGALAHAQFLRYSGDRDTGFMPQDPENVCRSVVCKLIIHLDCFSPLLLRFCYSFLNYTRLSVC